MNCYRCATPVPEHARYCYACGADVSGDTAQGMHPIQRDPELESKLADEVKGEFVIERLLGRGGMAAVFLARDLQLDRKVAIKVLPPELAYGPGLVERFKREARTAATLDHPHIVPIYRISKGGKLSWFAMKYIAGESLADVLEREKALSPDRCAAVLSPVAEALDFAHQHSVVHRDVKPPNVMVDGKGWVTVTDFGIAKAIGLQSLTSSESIVGTPSYISPEQCSGKRAITGASDQYSLGVVAYQILSGRLPFTGFATVDIIKQHCFDPPPPLDDVKPGLPRGLAAVVERALAKKPDDRFPSVTQFAAAFATAARAAAPRRAAKPVAVRRHNWRKAALGALGVVVATGVIGVLLSGGRGRQSRAAQPSEPSPQRESVTVTLMTPDETTAQQSPVLSPSVATGSTTGAVPPPPAETTGVAKPAPQPPRPTPRDARLFLRGVSEGATITVDGRRVGDSIVRLRPPGRHVITVTKPGFAPWADTLWADAGDQLARWVVAAGVVPPALAAVPESVSRAVVPSPEAVLRIQLQPPARIAIDKVDFGERRTLVRSVAGGVSHLISVVPLRSGYSRKDTTVTPRPGDTVTVRVRLEGGP